MQILMWLKSETWSSNTSLRFRVVWMLFAILPAALMKCHAPLMNIARLEFYCLRKPFAKAEAFALYVPGFGRGVKIVGIARRVVFRSAFSSSRW